MYREESGSIDTVLTFEELQALFDSRDIEIETLEDGAQRRDYIETGLALIEKTK